VHADLPQLTARAIDRFILDSVDGAACCVRAAACKEGKGTNLLLAPLPLPLPLVFGKNSLARFRQAAAAAGVAIEVVHNAALAADIDEIDDLNALAAACAHGELAGSSTAAFLLSTASVLEYAVADA
jgi:2-phospho-L-lactate guanylyltransferase (CobY/MobA/RfbA family)